MAFRVAIVTVATGGQVSPPRRAIALEASPPSLAQRDALAEVQAFRIVHELGILSPQTWSQRRGLDYDQEQANLAVHGGGK